MTKFEFLVAMDIRAYGNVTIEGENPEKALSALNAEYIADNFSPNGSSEDLDWKTPLNISVLETSHDIDDKEIETFHQDIPDGDWASGDERAGAWLLTYDPDSDQIFTKLFTAEEVANELAWKIAFRLAGDEFSNIEQLKERFDDNAADAIGELSGWMHSLSIDFLAIYQNAGDYNGS